MPTSFTPQPDSRPIAVLLDGSDAAAFLASGFPCRAILALTPAAQAGSLDATVPVFDSAEDYRSFGQRRTILHQKRAIAELRAACLEQPGLGPAAEEALANLVYYTTATSARLWSTLRGSGPWIFRVENDWVQSDLKDETHALVLRRILGNRLQATLGRFRKPPLPWLAANLSRGVAHLYRGKNPLVLAYTRRQLANLADEVVAINPKRLVLSIRTTRGSWRDYRKIGVTWWRAVRGRPRGMLQVVPKGSRKAAESAKRALAGVADARARVGIDVVRAELVAAAELAAGFSEQMAGLFTTAKPSILISDTLGWVRGTALGDAARSINLPVLLLSHSSHTVQTSAAAREVSHSWVRNGRVLSPFATTLLPKTVHAARLAEVAQTAECTARQAPYVWLPVRKSIEPSAKRVFRVLHAGNFATWGEDIPWVIGSSDQYVRDLRELVSVFSQIPNAELVIRAKAKTECNADILGRLLPRAQNITIRQSGSFADDLAESDLLIAVSSSTVEEALHGRVPVLLWGNGMDYRHLPAREAPPRHGDRAAVYAPNSVVELGAMLRAIIATHHNLPLQDSELGDHLWPSGTPSRKKLAQQLAAGEVPTGLDRQNSMELIERRQRPAFDNKTLEPRR